MLINLSKPLECYLPYCFTVRGSSAKSDVTASPVPLHWIGRKEQLTLVGQIFFLFANSTQPYTLITTTATKLTKRLRTYYHIAKMSLSNKLAITDVNLKGKRVLVRVSWIKLVAQQTSQRDNDSYCMVRSTDQVGFTYRSTSTCLSTRKPTPRSPTTSA